MQACENYLCLSGKQYVRHTVDEMHVESLVVSIKYFTKLRLLVAGIMNHTAVVCNEQLGSEMRLYYSL